MPSTYSVRDEYRVCTPHYEVKIYKTSDVLSSGRGDKPYPIAHSRPWNFDFHNAQEHRFSFETKIDDKGNEVGVSQDDKNKKHAYEYFFCQHPNVLINGKYHPLVSNALFSIIDSAQTTVESVGNFDSILLVANRVNEMSLETKMNVAYYFGKSPKGMNDGQLKMLLANFDPRYPLGVCITSEVTPGQSQTNIKRFLDHWLRSEASEERDMRVALEKAVKEYNLIQNAPKAQGINSYYLGTTFIGNSVDEMIDYFRKNQEMYQEFILRNIDNKENYTEEKKDSQIVKTAVETGKTSSYSANDLVALQDECKKLKLEGYIPASFPWHTAKFETLVKKVEEGRAAKVAAEKKKEEPVETGAS